MTSLSLLPEAVPLDQGKVLGAYRGSQQDVGTYLHNVV